MGRCFRLKKEIAESLLEIKAVTLSPNEPFTWASGIQSPIYSVNRLTLSYPNIRKKIAAGLADMITEEFLGSESVAATPTPRIPHNEGILENLKLPMCYVLF